MSSRRTWRQVLQRATRMSPHEVATRLLQQARQRRDGLRLSLKRPAGVAPERSQPQPAGKFFFTASQIPEIVAQLQSRLPEQAAHIVKQADKIRRHRFDLLGYEDLDFGEPIDWHLDPVHGKQAPRIAWFRVPYLDFRAVGDHKVTWELNRHQHLVTLAKAWWLTRHDGYLREIESQWRAWGEANPPAVGINWTSSLEIAFRCLSWLWLEQLLPKSDAISGTFRRDLRTELGRGARHIEKYLSTYFAPNTHLLGEAVALFFVGTVCPEFVSARRWQKMGWDIIVEQAKKQVGADGLHFEQSTYYHVYALDFFIHARLLAAANESISSQATDLDGTIERMADALCGLQAGGAAPRFGDDDGGRLFDGSRNRTEQMSDPLATCAVLFGREDFKAACPALPEEALWLLGRSGAASYDALPATAAAPRPRFFETSGIASIAAANPAAHQLLIDAGPQGFGNSGHGHADALSIQLIIEGRHALTDPGAFCYPVELAERNLFRGTSAHNTLEVDGVSQAEPGGSFAWTHLPQTRTEHWIETPGSAAFEGSHDGYARLSSPVIHRRSVTTIGDGVYLIRDQATGEGTHALRLFWHIGPEFDPQATDDSLTNPFGISKPEKFRFRSGQVIFELIVETAQRVSCRPVAGAWSPCYGRKVSAPVICCELTTKLPAEFVTIAAISMG